MGAQCVSMLALAFGHRIENGQKATLMLAESTNDSDTTETDTFVYWLSRESEPTNMHICCQCVSNS